MQRRKLTLLALMAAFLLVLAGCGSNGGSGGDQTKAADGEPGGSVETAETVGLNVCTNCHAGQTAQWIDGAHGNVTGLYGASATIEDATGFPSYSYFSDESCAACHDQLGDGERLTAELTGSVPRPVIGCESCHGGGQLHYGIGPVPYAQPDAERCGACHNSTVDHEAYHPEATAIYEKVVASPHFAGGGYPYVMGDDGTVNPRCSKCHTDEGAKLYKGISGTLGHDDLVYAFEGKVDLVEPNPIQCRTCHDAHNPNELLIKASETASAEFLTCTNCHQVADSYHGENNKYSWSEYAVGAGDFDGTKIIYDTHFPYYDDNGTPDDAADDLLLAEGYNIDPANERACRDCHDVHSAELTINADWAASGHGDNTAGWTGKQGPGRLNCEECHSASGAAALFATLAKARKDATEAAPFDWDATYGAYMLGPDEILVSDDGDDNDEDSYVPAGSAPEALYCATCHTDNAGGLYATGAITPHYTTSEGRAFPDVAGSNLCINCHAGKRGGAVENSEDRGDSHKLPAAGVVYGTVGYHFAWQADNYTATGHAALGTVDASSRNGDEATAVVQGTLNGPCVSCHMDGATHAYSPFVTVEGGDPATDIDLVSVCYACHSDDPTSGYFKNQAVLEHKSEMQAAAAAVLDTLVQAEMTAQDTGWRDDDATTGLERGLQFNAFLFKSGDKAAYVHNRYYAKQLIYDSIDYLLNGPGGTGSLDVNGTGGSTSIVISGVTVDADYLTETGLTNEEVIALATEFLDGDSDTAEIERK